MVKHVRVRGGALRQYLSALHVLGHRGQHLPETRVVAGIPEVAQPVHDWYAGAVHLLHVEAEVDQILAGYLAAPETGGFAFDLLVSDEIEAHAPQAQFQIDLIDCFETPARRSSRPVYCLVFVRRHVF